MSLIKNFIYENFVQPIQLRSGYNIINTITYGLILVVAVYGVYKVLKKLKLQININFVFSVLPFIFIGSSLRALVDAEVFTYSLFLITPGIYIVVFISCLGSILFGLFIENNFKIPYWWFSTGIGLIMASYLAILILPNFKFVRMALLIVSLTCALFLGFYLVCRGLKIQFLLNNANLGLICSHLFDASATYVGVTYFSYFEQHVLPRFLIQITDSAAVMFPLKIVVVVLAIYLIEKLGGEDQTFKNLIKVVILILGLGPGLRDTFRIAMGV